jgi:hypothetical protein
MENLFFKIVMGEAFDPGSIPAIRFAMKNGASAPPSERKKLIRLKNNLTKDLNSFYGYTKWCNFLVSSKKGLTPAPHSADSAENTLKFLLIKAANYDPAETGKKQYAHRYQARSSFISLCCRANR